MVKKQQTKRSSRLIKIIPLLALAVGFFLFFYFDGASYISFETLKEQREQLATWVARLGIFAPIVYGAIYAYALVVAFSLPLGAVMTITAGFLFGRYPRSVIYDEIGEQKMNSRQKDDHMSDGDEFFNKWK